MDAVPPGYAFRGPGLDRAELLRDDTEALARHWPAARVLVVDAEGNARFHGSAEAPEFGTGAMFADTLPDAACLLGLAGDTAWFALPHDALAEPLPGRLDLRGAAVTWPDADCAALAEARALLHWRQRTQFCGACGHPLQSARAGWTARCAQCGLEHYPRTDTAIIVAVSDGERLLLGRQAGWPAGRWSVLAGFVEPGESLEQAVAREVMEEAGVPVLGCTYAASQPWPFPAALMVGFHAQGLPVEPRTSDELEQVRWFSPDDLDAAVAAGELKLSPRISIARWLIDTWMARMRDGNAPAQG